MSRKYEAELYMRVLLVPLSRCVLVLAGTGGVLVLLIISICKYLVLGEAQCSSLYILGTAPHSAPQCTYYWYSTWHWVKHTVNHTVYQSVLTIGAVTDL